MRTRPVDVVCGYALELIVGALRGMRGALEQLLAESETALMRPVPARACERADRAPDEEALRRALRTPAPLPAAYADDRLVLLTRDPRTLFVYWDLAPGAERPARVADARLVLRIHDLTWLDFAEARAWHHDDFDVQRSVGSQYVALQRDAGMYRAEIGWRWADGTFVARARSTDVTAARDETPGHDSVRWLTVRPESASTRDPVRLAVGVASPPAGSPTSTRAGERQQRPGDREQRPGEQRAPSSEEPPSRGG